MSPPKKLQVFVSSTFTDLRDERQAAVEAILSAGHIPAGMELFAAGDESQMVVIRRWIDESDVFMLILRATYGSIEPESKKSYVQLEYEYAMAAEKPLFAVIVADGESLLSHDTTADAPALIVFRALVQQKMVRFWRDPRDIKLAIHETLAEFTRRPALLGWVRAQDGINVGAISEEVARLSRENALLRERLEQTAPRTFNGLTFEELFRLLSTTRLTIYPRDTSELSVLQSIARFFGHETPAPLHLLWRLSAQFTRGAHVKPEVQAFALPLEEAGLIELPYPSHANMLYRLTEIGRCFLLALRNTYDMSAAEELRA
jgi:hypothetical protein